VLVVVFVVGIAIGQSGVFGGSTGPGPTNQPVPTSSNGSPGATQPPASGPTATPGDLQGMDLFWQALADIRANFVGRAQLDDKTLVYGAIRGMVEALGDTDHTVFLTPQEVQDSNDALNQSVVGIGVTVGMDGANVKILSVLPDSPARAAGLHAGDIFLTVDGNSIAGQTIDQVVSQVRGDAGTTVNVTLNRPSTGETIDVSIVRQALHVPAAWWAMVPGTQVALIRLASFGSAASDDLIAARTAASAAGATSIILDLRGNPGGYVDQSKDVASQFLSNKVVYISEDANGVQTPVSTNPAIAATDIPLAVLVDNSTASAAEILAGAIQSAQRATIVGETTFGTGTVLNEFDLADGSALHLATQRWLTPDGVLIFGKGITPDDPVTMGPDDTPTDPADLSSVAPSLVSSLPDPQLLAALNLLGVPEPTQTPVASPPVSSPSP
jgi:carboxyl-terminal processing protease